jgi:hypothetical protein
MSTMLFPMKGTLPKIKQYKHTPRAQISTAFPWGVVPAIFIDYIS